jgi:hypothetical protein
MSKHVAAFGFVACLVLAGVLAQRPALADLEPNMPKTTSWGMLAFHASVGIFIPVVDGSYASSAEVTVENDGLHYVRVTGPGNGTLPIDYHMSLAINSTQLNPADEESAKSITLDEFGEWKYAPILTRKASPLDGNHHANAISGVRYQDTPSSHAGASHWHPFTVGN